MNPENYLQEIVRQFMKFGIIGISNTAISYIINIAVLRLLEPCSLNYDYVIANLVSFFISVFWSFHWNSRFVFHIQDQGLKTTLRALIKTYISYGISGIFLNNFFSWLWITHLGISRYIAPLINLVINVPFSFLLNKFWAFR